MESYDVVVGWIGVGWDGLISAHGTLEVFLHVYISTCKFSSTYDIVRWGGAG